MLFEFNKTKEVGYNFVPVVNINIKISMEAVMEQRLSDNEVWDKLQIELYNFLTSQSDWDGGKVDNDN